MKKPPKPKTQMLAFRITADLNEYLWARAARERRTRSNLVQLLIAEARQADKNHQPAA